MQRREWYTGLNVCTTELLYSSKVTSFLSCPQHPSWWWPKFFRLFWLPLHTKPMIQRTVNSVTLKSLSLVFISVLKSAPCRQGLDYFFPRCITSCLYWSSPDNLFALGGLAFCRLGNVTVCSLLQDTAGDTGKNSSHAEFWEIPPIILLNLEM